MTSDIVARETNLAFQEHVKLPFGLDFHTDSLLTLEDDATSSNKNVNGGAMVSSRHLEEDLSDLIVLHKTKNPNTL